MTNKHTKRCFASYIIKTMQIKTTVRYHYIPLRMAKIQNTDDTRSQRECGGMGTLMHCSGNVKCQSPFKKIVWWFLTQLKILLPYNLALTLFYTYPEGLKTYIHTQICTGIFIAVLLITAKTWKQPRCSSAGEWINCSISRKWNINQC